jgi:hypothetical protein
VKLDVSGNLLEVHENPFVPPQPLSLPYENTRHQRSPENRLRFEWCIDSFFAYLEIGSRSSVPSCIVEIESD